MATCRLRKFVGKYTCCLERGELRNHAAWSVTSDRRAHLVHLVRQLATERFHRLISAKLIACCVWHCCYSWSRQRGEAVQQDLIGMTGVRN